MKAISRLQTLFWLRGLANSLKAQNQRELWDRGAIDELRTLTMYIRGERNVSGARVLQDQEQSRKKLARTAQSWLFGPYGWLWALAADDAIRARYVLSSLDIDLSPSEKIDIGHEQLRFLVAKRLNAIKEEEGTTLFVCLIHVLMHLMMARRGAVNAWADTLKIDAEATDACVGEPGGSMSFRDPMWDPLESTCRHASLSIL